MGAAGLSPRVRGNPLVRALGVGQVGSIPARTGEPPPGTAARLISKVYPRAYGGTAISYLQVLRSQGLSPRVRGNHVAIGAECQRPGSIPARTGEPLSCAVRDRPIGVYPRAYGGTSTTSSPATTPSGLSPRVRGNHVEIQQTDGTTGSIPARTGEPSPRSWPLWAPRVYPRAYGGTRLSQRGSQ